MNHSKTTLLLIIPTMLLTACATQTKEAAPQTINVLNEKPKTNTSSFDCDKLYENYTKSMSLYTNTPQKKKSGMFKRFGKGVLNNAGNVASLAGVDFMKATRIGQAGDLASLATGQKNDPSDMMSVLGTASNTIEVQKTSNRLALENGCDIDRLKL